IHTPTRPLSRELNVLLKRGLPAIAVRPDQNLAIGDGRREHRYDVVPQFIRELEHDRAVRGLTFGLGIRLLRIPLEPGKQGVELLLVRRSRLHDEGEINILPLDHRATAKVATQSCALREGT